MPLIIDGYNLLHASDVFPPAGEPATFERARFALLDFLASVLSVKERAVTTIVFDASQAPPGLPAVIQHEGLTVRFARGYPDADTLIEEMIEEHASPRSLTIVSSDHRIQRAARRRRANPIDSEIWRAQIGQQSRKGKKGRGDRAPSKPGSGLEKTDIAHWLSEFDKVDLADLEEQIEKEGKQSRQEEAPPEPQPPAIEEAPEDRFENPFPPGYGEDLLQERSGPDDIFPPGFGEGLFDDEE